MRGGHARQNDDEQRILQAATAGVRTNVHALSEVTLSHPLTVLWRARRLGSNFERRRERHGVTGHLREPRVRFDDQRRRFNLIDYENLSIAAMAVPALAVTAPL
jgi:hypothetical protein